MFRVLIFTFVILSSNASLALRCFNPFTYKNQDLRSLHYSGELVLDAYQALPFPTFRFEKARPIVTQEVQAALDSLYDYRMATHNYIKSLSEKEARGFQAAVTKYDTILQDFQRNYDPFEPTSAVLAKISRTFNQFKGVAFEALTELLLVRSGFDIIFNNITPDVLFTNMQHNFLPFFDPATGKVRSYVVTPEQTELDIVAEKNGTIFIFEVKSISPHGLGLDKTLERLQDQLERQSRILAENFLGDRFSFNLITHFELTSLDANLNRKVKIDHVIPVLKDYGETLNEDF